jgi:hypothetical protein
MPNGSKQSILSYVLSMIVLVIAGYGIYSFTEKHILGHDMLPSARGKGIADVTALIAQAKKTISNKQNDLDEVERALDFLKQNEAFLKQAAGFAATNKAVLREGFVRSAAAEFSGAANILLSSDVHLERKRQAILVELEGTEEKVRDLYIAFDSLKDVERKATR